MKDILIKEDKILSVSKAGNISNINNSEQDVIDCACKLVMPGIIDPHVHFREPGMTQKEDFLTGSMAAAAGGITTVLDMPNTIPPLTSVELLDEKRTLAKKSIVNYGFHFGAAPDNLEEIKHAKNIASVKVFMNQSTGKLMIDDDVVLDGIFANSRLVAVHAEGEMVQKAINLSKKHNTMLYLCHVSKAEELEVIRNAKAEKRGSIFVEVTPHHLFLTEQDDKDSFTKMKPQLKSVDDQKALWQAVEDGIVDTIATDHAPHTIEEKSSFQFPYGVPGCETLLPLLLNAVNEGKLSISRLQQLCCENPVRIFCMKGKGRIEEGYDADLVVVDMDMVKKVDNKLLLTKCKWSSFHGKILKGWPVITIVNGNVVFDHGRINDIKAKEIEFLR